MWNIGADWWVWTIFIISMIMICFGYIAVGYWINEGEMKGIKPILLIYVLSGIIMALMAIAVFYRSETRMSPVIIANLPFILLLEFQNLISSIHGSQIVYILSGLCPSVLIHLGYNIKNYMINHKKR
jgi:hypothetical protein